MRSCPLFGYATDLPAILVRAAWPSTERHDRAVRGSEAFEDYGASNRFVRDSRGSLSSE